MTLHVATLTGQALLPLLAELGELRISVFRTWPYLYDGSLAHEERYIRRYAESAQAAIIVAFDGDRAVGASTCLPLADEGEAIRAPFQARGLDPARFFYFGESVLLPEYRGRGLGVAFFDRREQHARATSDCDYTCFCSVIRPADHPARPPDHVPLDRFWRNRGYTPYPDLICTMNWKDVGATEESPKALSFWIKSLRGAPLP